MTFKRFGRILAQVPIRRCAVVVEVVGVAGYRPVNWVVVGRTYLEPEVTVLLLDTMPETFMVFPTATKQDGRA